MRMHRSKGIITLTRSFTMMMQMNACVCCVCVYNILVSDIDKAPTNGACQAFCTQTSTQHIGMSTCYIREWVPHGFACSSMQTAVQCDPEKPQSTSISAHIFPSAKYVCVCVEFDQAPHAHNTAHLHVATNILIAHINSDQFRYIYMHTKSMHRIQKCRVNGTEQTWQILLWCIDSMQMLTISLLTKAHSHCVCWSSKAAYNWAHAVFVTHRRIYWME